MKTVKIGLIGAGTVGRGVIELLRENSQVITEKTGISLSLVIVCDKSEEALKSANIPNSIDKTTDFEKVINNDEVDIVIELIGGLTPAKEIVLGAIKKKKHVVTANKALLSASWKELFKAAKENKVFLGFEGSVGGAIPVIRTLRESFVPNKIEVIYGILNGTTNFMLTTMDELEYSFDKALALAQERGIAEKNPELDVSGKDSAHKLAILSLLGFGVDVSADDIYTEGITNIKGQDIVYAKQWGYKIKLLAIAKRTLEGLQLRVHPTLISSYHLLANVLGEDNAVFVRGDFCGEALLYGKGAGGRPTASSIVSDVVEIAEHVAYYGKENPIPYRILQDTLPKNLLDIEDLFIPYYLRFSVIDKPGVLASISTILADNNISIAGMSQEERKEGQTVPVIMLTHGAREGNMRKAINKIDHMDFVMDKTVVIRMEP